MIIGERIKQVREMRRFTQTALIDELGVPTFKQSQLSRVESGLADIDDEMVELLAVTLGVQSDFFRRPEVPNLVPQSPQLRARSRLTKAAKTSVMRWAQTLIEEYQHLERSARPISLKLENLTGYDPADAARRYRKLLGFDSDSPLPYLVLAVERLGVTVLGIPSHEDHLDAFCAWNSDRPVIGVLNGTPADRLRFSVAHELGHLVLHRDANRSPSLETEADEFAAELLTPRASMDFALPQSPRLSSLTMLKSEWGVSLKTLIRRARELGRIDQDRAISLYKQMSARGWNKNEPGFVFYEKPRALRKLAEISYGEGPNTVAMAKDAGWSEKLVLDVLDRHARSDELPSESPIPPKNYGDNVYHMASRRRS